MHFFGGKKINHKWVKKGKMLRQMLSQYIVKDHFSLVLSRAPLMSKKKNPIEMNNGKLTTHKREKKWSGNMKNCSVSHRNAKVEWYHFPWLRWKSLVIYVVLKLGENRDFHTHFMGVETVTSFWVQFDRFVRVKKALLSKQFCF